MTDLLTASLELPARLTDGDVSDFELVFSELLDSLAVSQRRIENGNWVIEAIFQYLPDLCIINDLLGPLFDKNALQPILLGLKTLPERDWLAENRAAFPPRYVGRFWVYGSHIQQAAPQASLPLRVDAGMAFGSGTHPTTEGCLRALEMISRCGRPRAVLDLGCGSAILAVAAHRIWPAAFVVAADSDPVAIRVAATNRKLNNISAAKLRLAVSKGFSSRYVRQGGPYDVILANILARPLLSMTPAMLQHVSPHGWLILSGILNLQAIAVRLAYLAQTFRCWQQIRIGEWTTLVLRPAVVGSPRYLWRGRCRINY